MCETLFLTHASCLCLRPCTILMFVSVRQRSVHTQDAASSQPDLWRGQLVYDRGVLFGLQTGLGRMESILMSLPRDTRWEYCHEIKEGSEEEKLAKALATPREWV